MDAGGEASAAALVGLKRELWPRRYEDRSLPPPPILFLVGGDDH
jgi:hypothetical protein